MKIKVDISIEWMGELSLIIRLFDEANVELGGGRLPLAQLHDALLELNGEV